MKKGDIVYGINQPGMIGEGIVIGVVEKINIPGWYENADEPHTCHELYTGPEDRSKSSSIFDYRLFDIKDIFATHEEASKRYFVLTLAGE